LVPPDFNKAFIIGPMQFVLEFEGAVMQKDENGVEKLIYYVSRALKKVETNYSVTDLEGTVALYCVKKFKHTYILR